MFYDCFSFFNACFIMFVISMVKIVTSAGVTKEEFFEETLFPERNCRII